jgi:lysophospholipase L1-like esterase
LPRPVRPQAGLGDDALVMARTVQQFLMSVAVVTLALGVARAATVDLRAPGQAAAAKIEDPAGAMASFYDALTRTERGEARARILHYGDSHVAADRLTGALRRNLQSCFGSAGAGFVLAGKPYSYYARPGVSMQRSGGWQADGLSEASLVDDGRFGLAGISFTALDVGESLRVTAWTNRFDLYLLRQTGGGAVTIFLDGMTYERNLSLAAPRSEALYVEVSAATSAPHSIEVKITKPGAVRLLGIDIERDTAGVIYDALGINGARMMRMLAWDWRILSSNIRRSNPDLIIIAYGSNEAGDADLNLDQYRERLFILLEQLREAAPRAALLVIAPPDRAVKTGNRWQTISRLPALVAAQRQAARRGGAAFFDLFHAMGGAGAIARWTRLNPRLAQPDRVHLTAAGYRLVADWLYEAMMRDWLASLRREPGSRFNR